MTEKIPEKIVLEKQEGQTKKTENQSLESLKQADSKTALKMMWEKREEFSPEIALVIGKKISGQKLSSPEMAVFDYTLDHWWKQKFGIPFRARKSKSKQQKKEKKEKKTKLELETRVKKRAKEAIQRYTMTKAELMLGLHRSLTQLDQGEPVEKFREKDRRTLYYNEKEERYYVLENDQPKFLSPADFESDFAWGLKYVPEGEMIEPAYRQIAKKILINEVRRTIEQVQDQELGVTSSLNPNSLGEQASVSSQGGPTRLAQIEKKWLQLETAMRTTNPGTKKGLEGFLAEAMARETIARLAGRRPELFFKVKRASALEDGEFKIDFKIIFVQHRRGVSVSDEQKVRSVINKIGFQFTIKKSSVVGKTSKIFEVKNKWKGKLPVDDIVVVQIQTDEFGQAFDQWLKADKPSGGPEQFLSEKLKQELWQKITVGLFKAERESYQPLPIDIGQGKI